MFRIRNAEEVTVTCSRHPQVELQFQVQCPSDSKLSFKQEREIEPKENVVRSNTKKLLDHKDRSRGRGEDREERKEIQPSSPGKLKEHEVCKVNKKSTNDREWDGNMGYKGMCIHDSE